MIIFLNGSFVREDQAVVSVFDRSFLYGDGLFETMRLCAGKVFRWEQHWQRLERGMKFLNLNCPFSSGELSTFAKELIAVNGVTEGVIRMTLSRGVGPRGYSPRGADKPVMVMSLHPGSAIGSSGLEGWKLITSSYRLLLNTPIAQFKTCNKLTQVMAKAEAEAVGAHEALLMNAENRLVEGASSNLFWIKADVVCTPPVSSGALAGISRAVVLEICQKLGISSEESMLPSQELGQTEGVFLSLSSVGLAEGISLNGGPLRCSPIVREIYLQFLDLVRSEGSLS